MRDLLARLLGREPVPDAVAAGLDGDEAVVATAPVGTGGTLVVTSWGVWAPGETARLGWHQIGRAAWDRDLLTVTPTTAEPVAAGVELLTDAPPRRYRLPRPGRVPQAVQDRVTGSIRTRNRRELPGGGAWVLQRRVPGRGGVVVQVRPDAGTDPVAARRLAEGIAARLPEA